MAMKTRNKHINSSLGLSCIEVYGQEINDLLNEGEAVGQSKVAASQYVLQGESMVCLMHSWYPLLRGACSFAGPNNKRRRSK